MAATIFVIDDDLSVRRGLARRLKASGYHVEVFSTAQEFLAHDTAETRHLDVAGCVIIDLRMPGMNGLELQGALRSAGMNLPILFMSGHSDVPATVQAMKAGALDFLTKPFDDAQLLRAVEDALAKDAATRAWRERLSRLTPREREVCDYVIRGFLNKQIAGELGTVEKTVKVHRARVMEKLEVNSVAELVQFMNRY